MRKKNGLPPIGSRFRASRDAEGAVVLSDLRSPFAENIETVQVGVREITLTGKATAPMKLIGIPPKAGLTLLPENKWWRRWHPRRVETSS